MKDYDFGYEYGYQAARKNQKRSTHNKLEQHVVSDKIKWIATAVAFVLVFVLIGGLFGILLRSDKGKEKPGEPTVKVQTHVLTFDDVENRTSFSELKQVWEDNGIMFTNLKGSGSNVGDYHNPVRLYTHSTFMVECEDMTRIVFYCVGATHVGNLRDSLDENGLTVSVNNNDVTLEFNKAVDSSEVTDIIGQIHLNRIAVTASFPVSGEDKTPAEGDEQNGGMITSPDEASNTNSAVGLSVKQIAREEFDDYGIMPLADSAFTVTATVKSEAGYTLDALQYVDFSLAWASSNSQALSNYVTITTTDTTATLTCKQEFTTQIILTAASRLDSTKKATVTLDYAKRVSDINVTAYPSAPQGTTTAITSNGQVLNVNFGDFDTYVYPNDSTTNNLWTYSRFGFFTNATFGTGTVNDTIPSMSASVKLADAFVTKCSSLSSTYFKPSAKTYTGSGLRAYSQKELLMAVSGLSDTATNYSTWIQFMQILAENTNQIEVTVTLVTGHSGTLTYSYKLNCTVEAASVGSVSPSVSSYIF